MKLPQLLFFLILFHSSLISAKNDSICGAPLRYQIIKSNEPTDGFFLIASDRKYNVYYRGADLILEQKKHKQNILWLITGASFNPYPGNEMYIDTAYFKNTSEGGLKELVVKYSLYSMKPDDNGKSRYLVIIDILDKMVLLNIAEYEHAWRRDENGKYTEYLYECDVSIFHNGIVIETSDDSDIDNAQTQLDDGTYMRKGHCYVYRK